MKIGGQGLSLIENLKTGFLYECKTCRSKWYLDSKKEMISSIPAGRYNLVKEWNKRPIILSETNVQTLQQIGASFAHIDRRDGDFSVPCRVERNDGESVDFSLIVFRSMPPINNAIINEFSADKIKTIFPSDYALPKKIRDIASHAPEIQMGVSPTHIVMSDGTEFVLSGTPHFLNHNEYKGCEIVDADYQTDFNQLPPVINENMNIITCFFADWSMELFRLFGGRSK